MRTIYSWSLSGSRDVKRLVVRVPELGGELLARPDAGRQFNWK